MEALGSTRALHMAPIMAFRNEFVEWDAIRRQELLTKLWNVAGCFRDRYLVAYSCSVLLSDWERARKQIPNLRLPEEICVNFCVGGLGLPPECRNEQKPLVLRFDRDEKFMHKVNRVGLQEKKVEGTIFSHIRSIESVDSSEPAIQLADMLAWVVRNEVLEKVYEERDQFKISSVLMIEHHRQVYDYDRILKHYPTGRLFVDTLKKDTDSRPDTLSLPV